MSAAGDAICHRCGDDILTWRVREEGPPQQKQQCDLEQQGKENLPSQGAFNRESFCDFHTARSEYLKSTTDSVWIKFRHWNVAYCRAAKRRIARPINGYACVNNCRTKRNNFRARGDYDEQRHCSRAQRKDYQETRASEADSSGRR